jgi:hypothetical protein
MSKTWREVSHDGVTWMRLPEGVTRIEPFPYRFTRLIEEEDLGAYAGPGGLRRALEAIQSGIRVSDSELANALRGATREEEAWFSAELRKARPGAAPAEPDPKLGEAIRTGNALASPPATIEQAEADARGVERPVWEAPPWRWQFDGREGFGCWSLLDRCGHVLIEGPIDRDADDIRPRVRALTEVAPDLRDALVRCVSVLGLITAAPDLVNGYRGMSIEAQAIANALLAQIEERAGG